MSVFTNPQEAEQFAILVAKAMLKLQAEPESDLMPLSEVMKKKKCGYGALGRWIKAAGIRKYQHGRGKAIKRSDYRKLP